MSHSASHADAHDHGDSHSHAVVGPGILRTILIFLLFFTVLTVAFAQVEVYVEHSMGIVLPWWVNVIGAMAIAVVKSVLVMAYFMQLKYDNPINTLAMLFCFFALGLFLMFTGLDLFSRGMIYDFKSGPVIAGGTGAGVAGANNMPLTQAAKTRFKERLADNNVREWLICAAKIDAAAQAAAHHAPKEAGAAAAAAVLSAKAQHMMDLHVVKVHPPETGSQAVVVRELEEAAQTLRANGDAAAAELVATVAREVQGIDMAQARASYSVDAMFEKLAAAAHGGHHEAHGATSSTGNASRARTGLTGVAGHGAAGHESGQGHGAEGTP
ncbi:MAG: cytochrome C oxidase subunit IV family protein [Phycisphaerae bacterium]|jgi:cytochrome c oxidase subunit 4